MDDIAAKLRSRAGKKISLVLPMHNEEAVLDALFLRIDAASPAWGVEVEIVCIDDGSTDRTLDLLRARAQADARLRLVALSRNFGKEAALTAGVDASTGDMLVPLDADLQDPPELIAEFIALWEQGYDVIYGIRADRRSDTALKRATAGLFYRVFNLIADYPIPADTGDFRLMDRSVVEAVRRLPERNRFMKGLFSWVGFRQVGVPYTRPERSGGLTSWGYIRLFRFAIDGITSFTSLPLRIWTVLGLFAALISILLALALIIRVVLYGIDVPGYASLMVVMLFGFSMQMLAFGVLGEYIGRLYEEAKGRPIYVVRERVGFAATTSRES